MKTILVTGGAGYIGSHVCKELSKASYVPVTYDNLVNGHESLVKWGPLEKGDLIDSHRINDVFNRYNPDAVMHLAALTDVGESVQDPWKYYYNNVTGSIYLFEAIHQHQIDKIIFSSSCATYGIPRITPIREDNPQNPTSPYGYTKLMIEQMLKDFEKAYGIRSISLRYFNAAGADPDGETGEDHNPETHLIPLILDAALRKTSSITVFGNDYDTPDGTCIRDYIHVTDIANAHVLALKALEAGVQSNAYNLSNGKGFSVKEVIDMVAFITGKQIPMQNGSRREGDLPCLIGDSQKALEELQWVSRYNDLSTIIETAWKWQLKGRHGRAGQR